MPDQRISRRSLLAGAAGTSALLTLPRSAYAQGPAVKKGTSLRLWILKTYVEPTNKAIEASAQRWAQKHGASVTVEYFTFEDMQTKYVAAIENKSTPDVGQLETGAPARFSGMGQLVDLTSFARQIEGQVGKPPANVAPVTMVGDKIYALPWYVMAGFWYVWRDVFEKGKVKLPNTFEEAKQAAAALNRPKDNFYGMGQSWNRTSDGYGVMQSLMYSYGAGWADKDGKYKSIKTSQMQAAMKWATDIYKDGIQPADTLTWTGSGNNENFIAKNIAQTSNGPSITFALENALAKATDAKERKTREEALANHVALPHPGGPDGRRMWAIAMSFGIFKSSKDPGGGDEPDRAHARPRGDGVGHEGFLRPVRAGDVQGARRVQGLLQQERQLPHVRPGRGVVRAHRLPRPGDRGRRGGAGEQRADRRARQGDRGQVVGGPGHRLGGQEDQGNLRHPSRVTWRFPPHPAFP